MTIKEDINKLTDNADTVSKLPEQVPAQTIGSALGVASFSSNDDDGQGVDSPLTEQSRIEVSAEKFDQFGVWSILETNVTQITMLDASQREVIFNFIDPNAPPP